MEKRNQLKKLFYFNLTFLPLMAAAFIFAPELKAKTIDLSWAAQKKKTIVSGTLNPASLSVNGQEVTQGSAAYDDLLINGSSVKINEVSGLKTFYEVVESDQINLQWKNHNGTIKDILSVSYPSVKQMNFENNSLVLRFNELTRKVRYDGLEISLTDPTIIPINDIDKWVSEPHTLELTADKNVSLFFNLDFKSVKTEMLTHKSWNLYSGDPPFSGNVRPAMIGAGARVLDEKNFSRELMVAGAKTHYGLGPEPYTNEATQQALLIELRYGYNPFTTDAGTISLKRLSLGLEVGLVNYQRESPYQTYMDGYSETKVNTWFNQGGYFLRWEPLQYKDFGLIIHLNQRIFISQNNISSDGSVHYFGLAYYF